MPSKNTICLVLHPEQLAILDEHAKDEGYSRSLACRRIIMEWADNKSRQLTDARTTYEVQS